MKEQQKHSSLYKWGKVLLGVIGGFLLLLILLRLSLKTTYVQNWVKEYALSTANNQLQANLTIEELSGDLWKEVQLRDLRITKENTIVQVDTIDAAYDILSLLGTRFEISRLSISDPVVKLRQEQGVWNIQQIVEPTPDTLEQDTTGDTFPFSIEELTLNRGEIYIRSDNLPVESAFAVRELSVGSSLTIGENDMDIDLQDLSFQIEQTRLTTPLQVQTEARADSNSVTLEKLIMATGNTFISSSAFVQPTDSTIRFNMSATPFSWKDAVQYTSDFPLRSDIEADLEIKGSPDLFDLNLTMEAEGLDSLQIGGQFRWQQGVVLEEFTTVVSAFDPEVLLSDTSMPAIQQMNVNFQGEVPFDSYEESYGDLQFMVEGITSPSAQVHKISGTMNLHDGRALANLRVQQNEQKLTSEIEIEQVWSDIPAVTAHVEGNQLNPGFWMQDSSYTGNINFTADVSGRGFFPDTSIWNYSLQVNESQVMNQTFNDLTLQGKVSSQSVTTNGQLTFSEGVIRLSANVQQLDTTPQYSFNIGGQNIDIGSFINSPNLHTALNGKITGQGTGFEPASMKLESSVLIDSSVVNEESIENFTATIFIQDSVAVMDSTQLQSTIVDGSFNGRFNLLHQYHSSNELTLDLAFKDISTFGPLVGTDTLQAEGSLSGNLHPLGKDQLQFKGNIDLSPIQYGNNRTNQLIGSVGIIMQEGVQYEVDLEFGNPAISGVQLQELSFFTEGSYQESGVAEGLFGMEFSSAKEGEIEHAGNYFYSEDSTVVQTTELNIISKLRTLSLSQSFNVSMQGDSLKMDTLRIAAQDTAFLEMAFPLITPIQQQGFFQANDLNMTVIQQALFEEPYLEGLFSGQVNFSRSDTSLTADGNVQFSELGWNGTSFDSLSLGGRINNKRLSGDLALYSADSVLVDGAVDLPFELKDPEQLPATFFDQSVKGYLTIHDISLDQFEEEFSEVGIEETTGILSLTGTLNGTAGQPEFSAASSLREGALSGVPVDSLSAAIQYSHDQSVATLDASLTSMKQKAAQVDMEFPLFINMKTFEVDLPQEQDSISAKVQTDNFKLSSVNDFLDPQTATDVKGILNGDVNITGRIEDLQSKGQFTIQNGAFRVVPAGIVVDKIASTIDFAPNEIRLSKFTAESGGGPLKVNGLVELEELVPDSLDIQVKAQNFQAANTDEYNAIVNLDARAGGTAFQPEMKGSLEIVSGFLELDNFGEKSVENIELDTTQQEEESFSAYDSLRMELEVSFDQRFYVRNERYLEMEIELGGQVDLVKERGGELQLFGTMNTEDGYALPLGKRFDLEEGIVTFSGNPENPEMNIRTQYEPPQTEEDIVIWYIIEGTVENPEFIYESQPQMELENILSYTLFGQPFYALDSWEQLVTNSGSGNGTTATSVALDVLLERVETVATQKLGIDIVRIENTRVGGENATSVTTGWYLNPKVFFAIQNIITGSSPNTGFLLEYMLRQNLELIIRQGNGIREGIDIRWEYDY